VLWNGERFTCAAILEPFTGKHSVKLSLHFKNGQQQHFEFGLDAAVGTLGKSIHRGIVNKMIRLWDSREEGFDKVPKETLQNLAVAMHLASSLTVLVAVDEEMAPTFPKDVAELKDGNDVTKVVVNNAEGILESIGDKLGLANVEEYGLQVEGSGKWLNMAIPLAEQGVSGDTVLKFKKRFFVDDLNVDKSDPVNLHLVYLQSRDAIVKGEYPVGKEGTKIFL
jgi:hypothetical protein